MFPPEQTIWCSQWESEEENQDQSLSFEYVGTSSSFEKHGSLFTQPYTVLLIIWRFNQTLCLKIDKPYKAGGVRDRRGQPTQWAVLHSSPEAAGR